MQHVVMPEELIAQRRRLGLDKKDEMWEGVLHMNLPGTWEHQRIQGDLYALLRPIGHAQSLQVMIETGVFNPADSEWKDFRTPDILVCTDEAHSDRGVEGRAVLAIEVRSPGDESFEKIPFYGRMGVGELLIIDRDDKSVRRWLNSGRELSEVEPAEDGWHRLGALPVEIRGYSGALQVRVGDRVEVV
jgi:Uma2 family endonuclease